ncbi:6225_t:CDS:2 [Ambispora leptoticha]|uniref:6225_t:CDS:1 n=1 Tax=Ambispora leptoticha TaxID=144679 RepID=A0A9N8WI33_9GLOM|nr:6225_t:CDS:2 [Ambispora leptoticha]
MSESEDETQLPTTIAPLDDSDIEASPQPETKPKTRNPDYEELFGSNNGSSADEGDLHLDTQELFGSGSERSREGTRVSSPKQHSVDLEEVFGSPDIERPPPLVLPNKHRADAYNKKIFLAKLPTFLAVNSKKFDPHTYDENEDAGDVANIIRWRNVKDESTGELKKQSNAAFVKWSDGSMSLLVGEEILDININETMDSQEYLMSSHLMTEKSTMAYQMKLKNKMAFRPSTTSGATHRRVTASIASRHVKHQRTKIILTDKDPEMVKKEMEKAEKITRVKRRTGGGTRRDYGRSRSLSDGYSRYDKDEYDSNEEENRAARRAIRNNDTYEDGTGFVADDDFEELEERRPKRGKSRTSTKSTLSSKRKRKNASESEEDEFDLDDDDEDLEEPPIMRNWLGRRKANHDEEEEEFRVVRKGKKKLKAVASDEDEK